MCFQELYSNVHSLVFIYTKLNHLIRSLLHEHNYETRLTMKILHIIKKKTNNPLSLSQQQITSSKAKIRTLIQTVLQVLGFIPS